MAEVQLSGTDMRLLARWSDVAQSAGHSCRVADIDRLTAAAAAVDACLVDLGPRRVEPPPALLDAIAVRPQTCFVALVARPEAHEGLRLLRAGVRGYCNRLAAPGVVDAVLASVLAGEIWAGPEVTDHLLAIALQREAPEPPPDALLRALTPREREIAMGVAGGHSNKVIAAAHGISERTVKAHVNSIFRKTGIRNRVQLALALKQREQASRLRSSG